jgi:hypothetical protein
MGGVDVQIHIFLTSALAGGECSPSRPCRFTPGERTLFTHCIRGLVGPRGGLNDVEKKKFLTLPGIELRPLGRPALSLSLYRLRVLYFRNSNQRGMPKRSTRDPNASTETIKSNEFNQIFIHSTLAELTQCPLLYNKMNG